MRVVSLNYLGVPPAVWPLIVICVYILARALRVVICCTRRSRGTPQEKPDDDGCQEKEHQGAQKQLVFSRAYVFSSLQ